MSGKKIKVVHICDKFGVSGSSIHGVSRLFSWWLPRFDKTHFEVKLVGLRKADVATQVLRDGGIDVVSLNRGKFDFRTLTDILKIIREDKPHILHLHGYGATNFGIVAGFITKTKCIVHEHFVDPAMPKYQIPFDFFLAKKADYGIAVSNSVKVFMVNQRYMRNCKIDVVFNGAPLKEFAISSDEEIAQEKEKWNIPKNSFVVGTVGRIDEQKGNVYLIDAAKKIIQENPHVIFMLVGDGPLEQKLKKQCQDNGIEDNIIFTGYQSEVAKIQSIFDVQIFPSLWEGTPLTLFEAMATKRAIVSTNVDGLGEVLENEKTALVVEARNSDALASSVNRLIDDKELQVRLSENAWAESKKYDIQATVDSFQNIYRKLI